MCSKFLKFLFARKFEERRRTIRTRRLWLLFLDRPGHPGSRSSPTPYHNRGGVGLASRDDFRRTKRRAALADITPRRHFHTKRSDNAKFYASGGPLRIPALLTVAPSPFLPRSRRSGINEFEHDNANFCRREQPGSSTTNRLLDGGRVDIRKRPGLSIDSWPDLGIFKVGLWFPFLAIESLSVNITQYDRIIKYINKDNDFKYHIIKYEINVI